MWEKAVGALTFILCIAVSDVISDDKIAPEDVTRWEVGMVFRLPEQTDRKYFEVGKVLDKEYMVVIGVSNNSLWYPPFVVKAPTKGLVDDKRIKLEKTYRVVDTKDIPKVRSFPTKTVYVIEETK